MLIVRFASKDELVDAARIYESCLQHAHWLPERSRLTRDFSKDTEGETINICADHGGIVLGFISVWTPESFIHHLYVDSNARRMGVGTLLLESLHSWLPKPWTLKCATANTIANKFYRSLGWTSDGTARGTDGDYELMRYARQAADG
ncbi:GNAT family N-acetyltransferase [Candidatus Laterigemmans baculatus]|uniref:GNAT family N-acetyltransferase n=1 Tax=Candidatus Laterigemmans baculatus TaxID=2770505 RepID=UPI0013D95E52|nr:GNAT family N-acetyltransferase [Candidatus Laterigemmans baculatus]